MKLSLPQINNLITGTAMAAELPAAGEGLRRFLVIRAYEKNDKGKYVRVSKIFKSSKRFSTYFWVRIYELPTSFIDNCYDVTEDCLTSLEDFGYVQGISALEDILEKHLNDFAILIPEDRTSAPL